ncbi:hypothetical protein [Aliiroseovarius sp.]|uniref:hypothetical protein n=1 Tax=Aliiroseovarius sp. TaxID=1872442 RepID=UPI002625F0B9|nr:hypothetical protein [Aliiroseovarius sp.]
MQFDFRQFLVAPCLGVFQMAEGFAEAALFSVHAAADLNPVGFAATGCDPFGDVGFIELDHVCGLFLLSAFAALAGLGSALFCVAACAWLFTGGVAPSNGRAAKCLLWRAACCAVITASMFLVLSAM